jgi:hypothetical protein
MALPGLYCPAAAAALRYRANAVSFDGANDYLTRGAGLTGAADSKLWTLSFWIRKQGSDGATERVFRAATTVGGGTVRTGFQKRSQNSVAILGNNAAGVAILNVSASDNVIKVIDGWVHVLASFDMADSGKRHLYINDASDLASATVYTDDAIGFVWADWAVGADPDGTDKLNGDLADLVLWPGVYLDLSVETNRRKFISAAGKPVYLGANGERPTGAPPLVFLSGPAATWHNNLGSGGGFTVHGALSDAPTSPSD